MAGVLRAAKRALSGKEAEARAERWLADHTAQLDATVRSIRDDAVKQAQDISDRRLVEAGTSRDRERLRLRSGLVQEALASLQKALVGLSVWDDYDAILTGVAAEVCERLRSGRVGLRLRAEDAPLGEGIARALRARFPKLDVVALPGQTRARVPCRPASRGWRR